MKIKLLVLLVCISALFGICYAASSSKYTTKDYLTKDERQALSTFYNKMMTCQSAQFNSDAATYKMYQNGNYCMYKETSYIIPKTIKCEFPLSAAKTFAKTAIELNNNIIKYNDWSNPNDPSSEKVVTEYYTILSQYCKAQ